MPFPFGLGAELVSPLLLLREREALDGVEALRAFLLGWLVVRLALLRERLTPSPSDSVEESWLEELLLPLRAVCLSALRVSTSCLRVLNCSDMVFICSRICS